MSELVATKDIGVSREKVYALEREIQQMPQAHCPIRHYFAGGIYAREMTIPAGVVLTGAVHRHEHLCTVSQGRIMVSTDEGMKELAAPCTIISKPGTKRVGYALETTVWTTYHITNETDLDKVMLEITESTNAELLGGQDNVQMKNNLTLADQRDYQKFLDEYGLTQEQVARMVEYQPDQIPMPAGITKIEIGDSLIHGKGMFAVCGIERGEPIAPARIAGKRTPAGRFVNHSCRPNCVFAALPNGDLVLGAIHPIRKGEEVTIDYRQAMGANGSGFAPIERTTK
jgi:hypothetical protein